MIVPIMGTLRNGTRTGIADALFTPVQQRVLGLIFGQSERSFQSAELIRLAGSGTGAVHRTLTRLAQTGLVSVTNAGNQKYYRANRKSPVFQELRGLIVKTVGIVGPLRRALAPKARHIQAAFVYGSFAKRADTARSDVDLLVISDVLTYPDLFQALERAEKALARPVNPNVMTRAEWRSKRAREGSFVARIARQPKLFVIGSDDGLK